ncbi:MAG: S8 family peptidase [Anaerolineae bacterium]|jgi:subtilisin family serine protease|nr:S8 family peptidase [Anaerolineae bacterium]
MKQVNVILVVCILAAFVAAVIPTPVAAQEETRVIIQYRSSERANVLQQLQAAGAVVHYQFAELNAVSVTLPAQALNNMRANADILTIEPDEPRYMTGQVVPYGVDAIDARSVWDADYDGVIDAGAPTGEDITICLIDSGIQRNHEDFQNVNILGGYPAGWDTDNYGHGTHVAGTIAAMNNTLGVVGVTPGTVSLYILKVFGDTGSWTYSSTLVDAAYKCRDAGADIISMSLEGANFSSIENYVFNQLYNDYGILSVAAAGNSGGTAYAYPASYDAVISVGAVDQNNVVASFSRRNDRVELVAPGVSIYSTYKNSSYAYMSGTSMATPHVSAAAALVWAAFPEMSAAEVRAQLQSTALDLGVAGRDTSYGYGLLQTYEATGGTAPTAVDLVRFDGNTHETGIEVTWETAMEIDNVGFHLYRMAEGEGLWTRLNAEIIPAQAPGSMMGAVYTFADTTAQANVTYLYRLDDVDVSGKVTTHGPITVMGTQPSAVSLSGFAAQGAASPLGLSLMLVAALGMAVTLFSRRNA